MMKESTRRKIKHDNILILKVYMLEKEKGRK